MIKEKEFILTNELSAGKAGKVITTTIAEVLMRIDRKKYAYMLVVMDTFDDTLYCVEVPQNELEEYKNKYNKNMTVVEEVILLEKTNEAVSEYLKTHELQEDSYITGQPVD